MEDLSDAYQPNEWNLQTINVSERSTTVHGNTPENTQTQKRINTIL